MHNAEVYCIFLRPNRVPVAGEAVTLEFMGQVELNLFEWTLHNEKETKAIEQKATDWSEAKSLLDARPSLELRTQHRKDDLKDELRDLDRGFQKDQGDLFKQMDSGLLKPEDLQRELKQLGAGLTQDRDRLMNQFHKDVAQMVTGKELLTQKEELDKDKALGRQSAVNELERNKNFELTFSKRVDISSTQMLNSMKAGDIFPSATINIIGRPLGDTILTFNLQRVRLLDYSLEVNQDDLITHLTEQWTCEFGALAYTYKNTGQTHVASGASQRVVTAATQGTVRAFTMKSAGSPI